MYGRAQHLKATRKTPYPAFFIVVVVLVTVPLGGAVVVVVGWVVVVTGANWLLTVSTTGWTGCR
jgi:hypothetical protein